MPPPHTYSLNTEAGSAALFNKSILKSERMHDRGNSSELEVLIKDRRGTLSQLGRENK